MSERTERIAEREELCSPGAPTLLHRVNLVSSEVHR